MSNLIQGALRGIGLSLFNSIEKQAKKTLDNSVNSDSGGGKSVTLTPGKHTLQLQVEVGEDGAITMGKPLLSPHDSAIEETGDNVLSRISSRFSRRR